MTLYAAEPGSPTEDALRLLASWAATSNDAGIAAATGHDAPETDPRSHR